MGALLCVDGSVLSVSAVNCKDRAGQPYEITLSLARDSVPFAAVGQRCGYQLSRLAECVAAARLDPEQAASWPDPDDRFPAPGAGDGQARRHGRPGAGLGHDDHEYFALRARDRGDLSGTGELRCVLLRSSAVWLGECAGTGQHLQPDPRSQSDQQVSGGRGTAGPHALPAQRTWPARPPAGGHGRWRLSRRAVIEAWGAGGVGVRAVLTSAELVAFLDTVLERCSQCRTSTGSSRW